MELETLFVIGMFLTFGALLMTGYPVAWVLGGTAVIWTVVGVVAVENFGANLWFDYQSSMGLVPERIWKVVSSETLVALPMFIFMGIMLDQSGVAERLQGSALKALEGEEQWEAKIVELAEALDSYIPEPERDIDKPPTMAEKSLSNESIDR